MNPSILCNTSGVRSRLKIVEALVTIDQMDVVDLISGSESDPEVRLIIADHLSWDEDEAEHLWLLKRKINKYLGFIESGEIYEKWPKAVDKFLVIELTPKCALSKNAEHLVTRFQTLIRSFGFDFRIDDTFVRSERTQ